jgi:MinD superfamily P-loop ATPase
MKIAIASGKGGTGKTTLAVNLAYFLANRYYNKNLVYIDLDVEEPDSVIFIQGELQQKENIYRYVPVWHRDKCTFCYQCPRLCNFNAIIQLPEQILIFPELCHSCYVCSDLCPEQALKMKKKKTGRLSYFKTCNINFIEGKLEIGEPSAVPLIKQTKEWSDNKFPDKDIFLYDCPPGNSCPVIESIANTDFVILITEPNALGLHDLMIAAETASKMQLNFGVVINKHGSGNQNVEYYCNSNNIPLLGKITYKKEIEVAYSEGRIIYANLPSFRDELEKIYRSLTGLIPDFQRVSLNS